MRFFFSSRHAASTAASFADEERAAIDADGAMAPLQKLAQVAAVPAAEIDDGLAGLDAGEPQRRPDVVTGELLRGKPSRRFEKDTIRVVLAQKVPFSR